MKFFLEYHSNLDDPLQKGNLVEFEIEWGLIRVMNWNSITYQDMDQNIVVLPSLKVAEGKIRNLSRPTEVMHHTFCFMQNTMHRPQSYWRWWSRQSRNIGKLLHIPGILLPLMHLMNKAKNIRCTFIQKILLICLGPDRCEIL
jgi:hypothetical protein